MIETKTEGGSSREALRRGGRGAAGPSCSRAMNGAIQRP